MSSLFSALSLSFLVTQLVLSQLNQYETDTGDNGEDIWRSTSDFVPVQCNSSAGADLTKTCERGDITIGEVMDMEFDITWYGYTNDPTSTGDAYENFFRVGFTHNGGTSCSGHGSRYPYDFIPHSLCTKLLF